MNVFAVTSPLFYFYIKRYFIMRTQKSNLISPAELEFLAFIQFYDVNNLIQSLKTIHELALYHTDVCMDTPEKEALFNVKMLWEELEEVKKGSLLPSNVKK